VFHHVVSHAAWGRLGRKLTSQSHLSLIRYRGLYRSSAVYLNFYPFPYLQTIRTPDDAPIRQKMIYASSKDAIRKQLVGISTEIQATDYDEISYDASKFCSYSMSWSCTESIIAYSLVQGFSSLSGILGRPT
jgi:hypothetical protein